MTVARSDELSLELSVSEVRVEPVFVIRGLAQSMASRLERPSSTSLAAAVVK